MALGITFQRLVFLPFVLAGGLSVVLLMNDLDDHEQNHRSHPIGKLVRLYGRIRFKPQGAFVWKETQVGQPLFRGDLLIAGPDSTALIEMEGGQELQLQPGSSVVLDQPKDLAGPAIKGSVLVHGADGKERFLTGGSTSTLAAETFSIQLAFPEELGDVFVRKDSTTKLRFSWRQSQASSQVKALELASDRDFQGSDRRQIPIVDQGSSEIDVAISEGHQFWRLIDTAGKPLSATRQFKSYPVKGLNAVSPEGPVVAWNSSVDFRWAFLSDDPIEFGTHWIEISTSPGFSSLSRKESIPAASLQTSLPQIPIGKFYWRVTSRYSNLTVSGTAKEFVVEKGKQLSVELNVPREDAVAQAPSELFFRWIANSKKARFLLEVETADGKPVKKIESVVAEVPVHDLPPGIYRWRVVGTLESLQSETGWRRFSYLTPGGLALKSPKPGEKVTVSGAGSPVEFEWETGRAAKDSHYKLELATDPEFREVVGSKKSKVARSSSLEFKLTPNRDYFWRVVLLSPSGVGLQISNPSGFHYDVYRGLAAPEDLLPQHDVVCNPLRTKELCRLSWSPLAGAAHYEVEVFKAEEYERATASQGQSSRPAIRTVVKDVFFQTKALSEGAYYWRVRAFDEKNRPGVLSEPQRFRITLGAPLLAPRGKSSEVQ